MAPLTYPSIRSRGRGFTRFTSCILAEETASTTSVILQPQLPSALGMIAGFKLLSSPPALNPKEIVREVWFYVRKE